MDNEAATDYWAFISYRHLDNQQMGRQWATWLHQQLESFEIPESLIGTTNSRGDVIPERLFPIFRDEEELPADADLSTAIEAAAKKSKYMIVLCSPRAVESNYVAEEIHFFKKIGRANRILAVLIDGEPNASWDIGKQQAGFSPYQECFPKPLMHPLLETGELDESKYTEPIAADLRLPNGGQQGWTNPAAYRQDLAAQGNYKTKVIRDLVKQYEDHLETGVLKIIAGTLGVRLETLRQRGRAHELIKARRRNRTLAILLTLFIFLSLIAVGAGIFGWDQKRVAQEQTAKLKNQTVKLKEEKQYAVEQRKKADSRYWQFRREQVLRKNKEGSELGFRQLLATEIEGELSDFDTLSQEERKKRVQSVMELAQDIRKPTYTPSAGTDSKTSLKSGREETKAPSTPVIESDSTIRKTTQETKFNIPQELAENDPELVRLIKNTESMDDNERQYWFDIWLSMTPSQQSRLKEILVTEKRKLEALEQKYQTAIQKINGKALSGLAMDYRKRFSPEELDSVFDLIQALNKVLDNTKKSNAYVEFIHGEIIEYIDYLYAWARFQGTQPDLKWFSEFKKFCNVSWLPENALRDLAGTHAKELYSNVAFFHADITTVEELSTLLSIRKTLSQKEAVGQWKDRWKELFLNSKEETDIDQLWNLGLAGQKLIESETEPAVRQYYYDSTLELLNKICSLLEPKEGNGEQMRRVMYQIASVHFASGQWEPAIKAGQKSLEYAMHIPGTAGKDRQCSNYLALSWYSLFKGDYQAAKDYAKTGLKIDPEEKTLETNLAHALWMSGEKEKAEQLYMGNCGLYIGKQKWEDVILDDFQAFKKHGIFPEDLKKISLQLKEKQ